MLLLIRLLSGKISDNFMAIAAIGGGRSCTGGGSLVHQVEVLADFAVHTSAGITQYSIAH